MSQFRITRATEWEQVEEAAQIGNKCIRPEGANWKKAKETWETLGERVIYYLIRQGNYPHDLAGYVRLFRTTSSAFVHRPTWAVDFMFPVSSEVIVMVADDLKTGTVLTKGFFGHDIIARHWPKVALNLSIPTAPYRICNSNEAEWTVVIP